MIGAHELSIFNSFFSRMDRVLRRSLGVSEDAQADTTVKPAPPVDPELPEEEEEDIFGGKAGIHIPDHMKDEVSEFLAMTSRGASDLAQLLGTN